MFEQMKNEWAGLSLEDKCSFVFEILPSIISISVALVLVVVVVA